MPKPLAICIEDLEAASHDARYLCCTAVCGSEPGLRLDPSGRVTWKSRNPAACEIWVSADERLIL